MDDAGPTEELEGLQERGGVAPHLGGAHPSELSLLRHLIQVLSEMIIILVRRIYKTLPFLYRFSLFVMLSALILSITNILFVV